MPELRASLTTTDTRLTWPSSRDSSAYVTSFRIGLRCETRD